MQFKTQKVLLSISNCAWKSNSPSDLWNQPTYSTHNSKKQKTSLHESICKESHLRIIHGQQGKHRKVTYSQDLAVGKCTEYSFVQVKKYKISGSWLGIHLESEGIISCVIGIYLIDLPIFFPGISAKWATLWIVTEFWDFDSGEESPNGNCKMHWSRGD